MSQSIKSQSQGQNERDLEALFNELGDSDIQINDDEYDDAVLQGGASDGEFNMINEILNGSNNNKVGQGYLSDSPTIK